MNRRLRRWGKNGSGQPKVILVLPLLEEAGLDPLVLQVYYTQVSFRMHEP